MSFSNDAVIKRAGCSAAIQRADSSALLERRDFVEILSRFQACDDGRILPEVKSLQMRDAPARFKLRNLSLLSQERRADSFHTGSSRTQAVELRVES